MSAYPSSSSSRTRPPSAGLRGHAPAGPRTTAGAPGRRRRPAALPTSARGGLPAALVFSIALLAIAAALLSLSQTNTRLTHRNEFRAQARAVAESELEHLYYLFKDKLANGTKVADIAAKLSAAVDNAATPTTERDAYLTLHRSAGWKVRRSMHNTDSFTGVDAATGDYGDTTYVEVRIEVIPPAGSPWRGLAPIRYARQFSSTQTSIFQKCIFYQGDLEMAPGGDVTLGGDIMATGSIYLGASDKGSLTINANVYLPSDCGFNTNPGADKLFGTPDDTDKFTTYRKPGTASIGTLKAPTFPNGRENQVKKLDAQPNFLGGADPVTLQAANSTLFPTVNDVYRALIVPPPSVGNTNEYADTTVADATAMKEQRIYNRAGLIVTVDSAGAITVQKRAAAGGTPTDVTSEYAAALTQVGAVYDQREKCDVAVTEVDLAKLKALAATGIPLGTVYVNLKNGTAANPAAVRLVNAEELPNGATGFTLATNGGLYVKGSYNTTNTSRSLLMADAMTVLSNNWSDANAKTTDVTKRKAKTDLTIQAALLLGNTPASGSNFSGGAQNLVRFLEDWSAFTDTNGKTKELTVTFNGSFGRLFDSKMFTRPFQQPGGVYIQPKFRNFVFDATLRDNGGPPGGVYLYRTARGRFYQW